MKVCLLIHGFTGGEHEVSPVAAYLEAQGYIVQMFTLPGHGGSKADLRKATRHDWIHSAEVQCKQLLTTYSTIHLIGFSTGALIAAHLVVKYPNQISSLTMLSAPVFPLNPQQIIRSLFQWQMVKAYIRNFCVVPATATREFYRIVRESLAIYPQVQIPVLIVQGDRDHLVKMKSAAYLATHLGTRHTRVIIVPGSGHLVCYATRKSAMFEAVQNWVDTHHITYST
ncbi:alpha/beta hydrolase [Paenibacillus campi]|uniref:alpha/beta hydrolase n=1 Tax=Paenibacillus campi TaxID=3106031 RepID=UPI002B003C97|nr:alpha/beta fold hydrolase [Paenibacillus sp. SGZ-1014]